MTERTFRKLLLDQVSFDNLDINWEKRLTQIPDLDEDIYQYMSGHKRKVPRRVAVRKEGESWFGWCTCPSGKRGGIGPMSPCKHMKAALLKQPEFDSGGGLLPLSTEQGSKTPPSQSTKKGRKTTTPPRGDQGKPKGGGRQAPRQASTTPTPTPGSPAVRSLFKEASNRLAYAKTGFYGPQGSGKTTTGMLVAVGLAKLADDPRPIFFVDTETGSDFFVEKMKEEEIPLYQVKTRAFKDLRPAIEEAECAEAILIIDSVSHFWDELLGAYDKKLKRHGRFQFQDWAAIKGEWRSNYTTPFVAAACHIIVCGRQQAVYEEFFDETGKKDIMVTGDRMRAEKEFGYEPHLVVKMEAMTATSEQLHNAKTKQERKGVLVKSDRLIKATVIKDRADKINGQTFTFPGFEDFWPHYATLNLGGEHLAVDTTRNSEALFNRNAEVMMRIRKQCTIALEEIKGELTASFPGLDKESKSIKTDLLNAVFGTRSWTAVEEMPLNDLQEGLAVIREAVHVVIFTLEQKKTPDLQEIATKTRAAIQATHAAQEEELENAIGGTPRDLQKKEEEFA